MLQSLPLKKSGHNKFAEYKYFELGDFLPQVQDIFGRLGLTGIVSYEKEMATLRIIDTEDLSEVIIQSPMSEAQLRGCHAVQNLGAVETYIRRYLWVTAMEIVEHDPIDSSKPKTFDAEEWANKIRESKSLSELKSVYTEAFKAAKAEKADDDVAYLIKVKNEHKATLEA